VTDEENGPIPPRGWETPDSDAAFEGEVDFFLALIGQLLAAAPEELRLRLTQAARALLQALRALLDWLAERLTAGESSSPVEVHDIPIL
jgi:hypothetical protein